MASPAAMAACLRADARLLCADMDSDDFQGIVALADDVNDSVSGAVREMNRPADDVKVILMLAAAAALEE